MDLWLVSDYSFISHSGDRITVLSLCALIGIDCLTYMSVLQVGGGFGIVKRWLGVLHILTSRIVPACNTSKIDYN